MATDIDFRIVKTENLPPHFRPSTGRGNRSAQQQVEDRRDGFPDSFLDVLEQATGNLTKREEGILLDRLQEGSNDDLRGKERSREEWRDVVANGLKREANRLMAAAAAVRQDE